MPIDPREPLSRRRFLARAGLAGTGAAAAFAGLPANLGSKGWLDVAAAQDADTVRDTLNGLVAFVVPGPDEYSVAQGAHTTKPGGIAASATDILIITLDRFLPSTDLGGPNDDTVPLSGAVAGLLNTLAAQVDPAAVGGPFPSHFARLSFAEKAEVFRRIEATDGDDEASRNIRFVGGILPGLTTFLSYGEWKVLRPGTKTLRKRPVGWELTGYQGNRLRPVEGWDDLKGYYRGRRKARG